MAGVVGFEPTQCWSQSPMPYRLATPHRTKRLNYGVIEGNRTLDLQSHNLAFYQLNYDHHIGAPRRIRTFDLCLRRALLYPAELWKQMEQVKGIGPSQPAWKASVLPLNYTCILPYQFNTAKVFCQENYIIFSKYCLFCLFIA